MQIAIFHQLINHWTIFSDEKEKAESDGAFEFEFDLICTASSLIAIMLKHPFPTFIGGRRKGVLAPVGGEAEDPLGLDVESSGGGGFPEEQLQACVNMHLLANLCHMKRSHL